MLFAHSGDQKRGVPAQDYATHVDGVVNRASMAAEEAARYALSDGNLLREVVSIAAEFHDLGKLDNENQEVLSGKRKERHLPIQHTDAGTAYLLNERETTPGAVLVRSHHIGLPDFVEEANRADKFFRDEKIIERVNQSLAELVRLHKGVRCCEVEAACGFEHAVTGNAPLFSVSLFPVLQMVIILIRQYTIKIKAIMSHLFYCVLLIA